MNYEGLNASSFKIECSRFIINYTKKLTWIAIKYKTLDVAIKDFESKS
jgi:hypothetical protein